MPRRPRSHTLEKVSRNRLHEIFTQAGWVVWDLQPDYGEDLLVRIFIDNLASHYSFFIQAKATDHIERYTHKDKTIISFPINADHLELWEKFWEPVILTVWDANSDITYWASIQDQLANSDNNKHKHKKTCIDIPTDNILDKDGVRRIAMQTKSRYARFERELEGTKYLLALLEDHLQTKVDYNPQRGILIVNKPVGGVTVHFFGWKKRLIELIGEGIESAEGISWKDDFANFILCQLSEEDRIMQEYEKTGQINIRDKNGNILEAYKSPEERQRYIAKQSPSFEELDFELFGFE